jgi:dTDP-4-dehydrorhamnose reductase
MRTAWVYSPFGKNFVKTMLKLAETRDALSVVSDQWGNPTSALDIADAIIQVADHLAATPEFSAYGVYHLVGTGDTNWSGFARAIFSESAMLGGRPQLLRILRQPIIRPKRYVLPTRAC